MLRYIFCFILFLGFLSCKNNNKNTSQSTPPPVTNNTTPKATPLPYPALPDNITQDIFNRSDFVDYIFYDPSLPMSISLDALASVRSTFKHFSKEPAVKKGDCKAMGRVLYQSDGEFIMEADFYFSENCAYYVFMVDQKPTYASAMTSDGIAFFSNNIKQAKASVLKNRQQQ